MRCYLPVLLAIGMLLGSGLAVASDIALPSIDLQLPELRVIHFDGPITAADRSFAGSLIDMYLTTM